MLTKEAIEILKEDGLSFEQITSLNSILKKKKQGNLKFYSEEDAISMIHTGVDNNIKEYQCIK